MRPECQAHRMELLTGNQSSKIFTILSESRSNQTTDTSDTNIQTDVASKTLVGMILVLINLATIGGNLLVLVSVAINKKLQTVTNCFVVSLATADLLLGVSVLPFSMILQLEKRWLLGAALCDIWAAIDVLCCTASIYSLCAISVDRYIGVTRPLQHRQIMSRRKTVIFILLIWFTSTGISIGPLIGWREKESRTRITTCTVTTEGAYVVFSSVSSFYIPALITIAIYAKIYQEAIKQSKFLKTGIKDVKCKKNIGNHQPVVLRVHSNRGPQKKTTIEAKSLDNNLTTTHQESSIKSLIEDGGNGQSAEHNTDLDDTNPHRKSQHTPDKGMTQAVKMKVKQIIGTELLLSTKLSRFRKERRAAKTLGIVVGVFILCWFPFFFILPLDSLCPQCKVPQLVFDISFWLGYCNSMLNPMIYAVWNRDFKRAFIRILRHRFKAQLRNTQISKNNQSSISQRSMSLYNLHRKSTSFTDLHEE